MREIGVVVAMVAVAVVVGVAVAIRQSNRRDAVASVTGPAESDEAFWARLRRLVHDRRKIEAIKLLRERTGLGLKEAKDEVERFERTGQSPPTLPRKPSLPPDLLAAVGQLKSGGRVVEAVKLVRQHTGLGLKEAKAVVDAV